MHKATCTSTHACKSNDYTVIIQGDIYDEDWHLYAQSKTYVTMCMHINSTYLLRINPVLLCTE